MKKSIKTLSELLNAFTSKLTVFFSTKYRYSVIKSIILESATKNGVWVYLKDKKLPEFCLFDNLYFYES